MPYVAGRSLRQAKNMLEVAGLGIEQIVYRPDLATNYVLEEYADGKRVSEKSRVQLEAGSSLYFVARGDGSHVFSDDLDAHNNAVREYQLKRRADYRSSPAPANGAVTPEEPVPVVPEVPAVPESPEAAPQAPAPASAPDTQAPQGPQ